MLRNLALITSLFAAAPAAAQAFRYQADSGRCLDAQGAEGLNPGYAGQCGDLTHRDLTHLDLRAADLRGADLAHGYLRGMDLRGADLRGANLYRAHLSGANLEGANLARARLDGAYLYRASLSEADLRGAHFNRRLKGADLAGVDLRGSRVCAGTQLPFGREEALRRGLVFVPARAQPGTWTAAAPGGS